MWPIVRSTPDAKLPGPDELKVLASLLNDAERITLFCGRGCAGAHRALMQLAEILKSPIVRALGGKEYVEYDNPYDVGITGFIGFSSGYAAMHSCDVLLMLGTDFPYKQFFPANSRIAQIDIRPDNLGRRCKIDLGLVGDVGLTIEALLPLLKSKTDRRHLDNAIKHYKKAREGLDALAQTRLDASRSILNISQGWSAKRQPMTPSLRPTSARPLFGLPAISQ